jgi:hypothetical protein
MKRFTKLSLATFISLSSITTFSNAGEDLSEAFTNLKIKGELKAGYVDSNFLGATNSDSISAVGGSLNAITGDFYGLKAGATFQGASILNDDLSETNTGPFNVNGISKRTNYFNASEAVVSESYLEYAPSNTSLKAGRQFIVTPIVSSGLEGKSSESIIRDSFEAYVLTNTDLPNTTLVAAYIDKWQSQSDGSGSVGNFEKLEDGAYTVYAKNNSISNLTLQSQYLIVNGITSDSDKNVLFLQTDYQVGPHTLSAQYYNSTDKTQNNGAQDGQMIAVRATGPLGLDKLGYLVGYSDSLDKNGAVFTGLGEGETDTILTALPVHDGGVPSRPDTNTLVGALIIPISDLTLIGYAGKSMSTTHPLGDVTGMGTMAIYPVAKNLMLRVNYERVEVEKLITEDTNTTRIYLTYKF